MGPRGIKCAFVGYATSSKAYRLLNLESNTIIESKDVEFLEHLLASENRVQKIFSEMSLSEVSQEVQEQSYLQGIDGDPNKLRKSIRVRQSKTFGPNEIDSQCISFNIVEGNRNQAVRTIPFILQVEDDLKTYKEAMASRDASFWKDAIQDEMDSILSNHTWKLVDLPTASKPIGCKWVFRKKYHTDGTLHSYKARLVAKGFRQKEGIDYFDTYAPVARITSIRIIFAIASIYNLHVHQMDVKTAFLNGDLNEEVYMEQPE